MKNKNRKSGINIIGDIPWGTHICQFYRTREDLIDILVPYYKAGLENNEFCIWIVSEPLRIEEAKEAMRKEVVNLDDYLRKGQIEIIDAVEWYAGSGRFSMDMVLKNWAEKEQQAVEKGFDGIRASEDTFWLEKNDWPDFINYEKKVNKVIDESMIIAICTYSLDKCGHGEIIDVVSNHQIIIIKEDGEWKRIEISSLKESKEKLENQKLALEQKNLALKEVIEHVDRTKNKLKENISINVSETILPVLERLKTKGVSSKHVDVLHRYLEELTSSFGSKITQKSFSLTPREIEICNMIRKNFNNKEICDFLNISLQTVEMHRKNIRKKLNISNKNINLTSYLQGM
ncbi:MAG: MEDS domain-containing protein [bacterium]